MNGRTPKLVVVSNRLPVRIDRDASGQPVLRQGTGGLITAMAPVLRDRGGSWIGWSGDTAGEDIGSLFDTFSEDAGYALHPVRLTPEQILGYYDGFSNEILWPLFHDLPTRCNFYRPDYWKTYQEVNRVFAQTILQTQGSNIFCWIHDYHLMLVAGQLAEQEAHRRCGFFLHIPFPPPDIFLKLPWRKELLLGLLQHELVGFQTLRDRRNFVACMQALLPRTRIEGRGSVIKASHEGRSIRLGVIPISIDYKYFSNMSSRPALKQAAQQLQDACSGRLIVLGVDRLDYTKGIPERLEALRLALQLYPELRERVVLSQILVPSRQDVEEYRQLKKHIEQLISEINGQFSTPGWQPVQYQFRNLPREELIAWYIASQVMFVTPLRDGMNLVAKEFVACRGQSGGVLILSEFAGAAAQLQRDGALLVNPYDIEGMAHTLARAFSLSRDEQIRRLTHMRDSIRKHDIYFWCNSFLQAALSLHLEDFPLLEAVRFHELDSQCALRTGKD